MAEENINVEIASAGVLGHSSSATDTNDDHNR
jgi:hypothetical protein